MDHDTFVEMAASTPPGDYLWRGIEHAVPKGVQKHDPADCTCTEQECRSGTCRCPVEELHDDEMFDAILASFLAPDVDEFFNELSKAEQTETFESTFADIFREAFDLLVQRQKKYGPENVRKLGIFGVFGRLADDKVERIRRSLNGSLVHGQIVLDDVTDFADESFEDALLDIANYALILIALKRGVWGRPLEEELA